MKLILKNSELNFITSKTLVKNSVIENNYMTQTGVFAPGTTYSVTVFDVSKLKKVRVIGNIGSSSLPLTFAVAKISGYDKPSLSVNTNTASYDQIIDVLDADILYVNSLKTEVSNVECQIVEFDTLDAESLQGNMLEESLVDSNGDITSNQWYIVGKYNVEQFKYVNVFTTLQSNAVVAYALKKNEENVAIKLFDESTNVRKSFIVDVREADEIWVNCLKLNSASKCYVVR